MQEDLYYDEELVLYGVCVVVPAALQYCTAAF